MSKPEVSFEVYDCGDHMDLGSSLKLEHTVYCAEMDISPLIEQGEKSIQSLREKSAQSEQSAYEIVLAAVRQWEKRAAQTQLYDRALKYLHTPALEHTSNQWEKRDDYRNHSEISNMVYIMTHSVWEDTNYNRETKQYEPVAWYITWDVCIRGADKSYSERLAGQRQKRYTDKAAAEKYLQGRIDAYAHLFKEISPPIPQEYARRFMVHGCLLPGYTIKGQESQRTEPAAAEVSDGGVSMLQEKTSVLGQLAVSKSQSKEKAPSAVSKKNPDTER